jgi:hypothetical protein
MGVDLTLLPVHNKYPNGDHVCRVALDLDLNRIIDPFIGMKKTLIEGRVFAPIAELPSEIAKELLPSDMPWIGGPLQQSFLGLLDEQELRYVLVKDIVDAFSKEPALLENVNDFERAGISYVSALAPGTKVILYWW